MLFCLPGNVCQVVEDCPVPRVLLQRQADVSARLVKAALLEVRQSEAVQRVFRLTSYAHYLLPKNNLLTMLFLLALDPSKQAEEFAVLLVCLQQLSEHGLAGLKQPEVEAYLCNSKESFVIVPVFLEDFDVGIDCLLRLYQLLMITPKQRLIFGLSEIANCFLEHPEL